MSYKQNIQIYDLAENSRLEMTCEKCGSVYYLKPSEVIQKELSENPEEKPSLYLDEVELNANCRKRGCNGHIRLSLIESRRTSSFVGGMA